VVARRDGAYPAPIEAVSDALRTRFELGTCRVGVVRAWLGALRNCGQGAVS
jgi:hypothetical protein